jgi:hypothetical protein
MKINCQTLSDEAREITWTINICGANITIKIAALSYLTLYKRCFIALFASHIRFLYSITIFFFSSIHFFIIYSFALSICTHTHTRRKSIIYLKYRSFTYSLLSNILSNNFSYFIINSNQRCDVWTNKWVELSSSHCVIRWEIFVCLG